MIFTANESVDQSNSISSPYQFDNVTSKLSTSPAVLLARDARIALLSRAVSRSTSDDKNLPGLTSILHTAISHFTIGLAIWCKPCHRSRRARPPALYRGATILRSHDYRDGRDYRVTRKKISFPFFPPPPPRHGVFFAN